MRLSLVSYTITTTDEVTVVRSRIKESFAEDEELLRVTRVRRDSSTGCLLLFSLIGKEESVIHPVL